jgi:hypothetical protein
LVCNDRTNGDCQPKGKGSWAGQKGSLAAIQGKTYTGELGFGSAAAFTTTMSFSVDMLYQNPNTTGTTPLTVGPTVDIRCDSAAYFAPTKGGCAYPSFVDNIFDVSAANPKIAPAAEFMADAQNEITNHAGQPSSDTPLQRTTNKDIKKDNREVACKGVTSKPGNSCDEYPFATTYQGAAQVPVGDWKSKSLKASANSLVGSYLSTFVLKNRIMDGDPYYVNITS